MVRFFSFPDLGFGAFSLRGLVDLKEKDGFEGLAFGADLGVVLLGLDLPRGVFLEAEEVGNKKRRQPLETSTTDIDEDEDEAIELVLLLLQSMPLRSLNGLLGLFLFFFFSFLLFDEDDDNCRFNISER